VGVVALGVTGGILLSWSPSDASDLTGYRVYRAEREGGPFEPLTEEVVDVPSFSDQELAPGKTYFYSVSAVDGAKPANESARSAVVSAEVPER
jgi:fibronectin type 3 domain-containing protein